MLARDSFSSIPGDEAWLARERLRRRRERALQAALALALAAVIAMIAFSTESNLAAKHIRSGFQFLGSRAGFEISDVMLPFSSADPLWKAFLVGLLNTLKVSALSIATATMLGIVVGLMRLSRNPLVRFFGAAHVEAYRNIPLLVLLLALYLVVTELLPSARDAWSIGNWFFLSKAGVLYAVPASAGAAASASLAVSAALAFAGCRVLRRRRPPLISAVSSVGIFAAAAIVVWILCGVFFGWNQPVKTRFSMSGGAQLTPEFLTLWLGLTLFMSASIAEIVRAGIQSVRVEQRDAGLALGMTHSETMRFVIFPQALRLIIPPLASQYMSLTKNSSLAVMVGYSDVVSIGTTAMNVTGQALEVICIIMGVYLTINIVIAFVMNRLNARVMSAKF